MATEMFESDAVLDLRVPPEPRLSRVVRESVADFARSHGVSEDDLAQFLAALGEALANAMEHARANVPLRVEVRLGNDRIVATVQDNGVGFASTPTMAESELPNIDSERGRGLPIMRRCSDIFAVNSTPGKGTAVILGRYLRTPERDDAEVA